MLVYEDSENIKADRVNRVVVNLRQIKCRGFVLGHLVDRLRSMCSNKQAGDEQQYIFKRTHPINVLKPFLR